MRQTLFWIPLDTDWQIGPLTLPGFGFGIVLAAWCLFGLIWAWRVRKRMTEEDSPGLAEVAVPVAIWCFAAFAIIQIPSFVQRSFHETIGNATAVINVRSGDRAVEPLIARGDARNALREYDKAADDYRQAIAVAPERDDGYLKLAWLRASCPDSSIRIGDEALALAQKALSRTNQPNAVHYDTMAVALAETGDFQKAADYAQLAATDAHSAGPQFGDRLEHIRRRLALFTAGKPFHESRIAHSPPQSLPVFGYGFMLFVGFICCGKLGGRLAESVGMPRETVWDVGVWVLLSGVVGARLFYIVQYHERVFGGKSGSALLFAPFQLQDGGLVLLGGVVMGAAALIVYTQFRKIKPLLMADVAVPCFFLALAFGRLGCLMNGCCYGDRCELPWGVEFPAGSVPDMALVHRGFVPPDSLHFMSLHPSQVYSSVNALVLAIVTAVYFRYRTRDGAVLAVGWLIYPITRFVIEYLRGDEMGKFGTSFTISQVVSMGMFATGLVYVAWLNYRAKPSPTV